MINMQDVLKKIALSIAGLMQGTVGSYFALLGYAFAFPDTKPGMRDYEEDMFFVPWGYVMMLIWVAVMVFIIVALKKNKANIIAFLFSWFAGLIGCLVFVFVIHYPES